MKQMSESGGSTVTKDGKKCRIKFTGKKLVLTGDLKYARAEYVVGEDCSVTNSRTVFSTAPVSALPVVPKGSVEKSKSFTRGNDALGAASTYGCTVNVWEEDFPGIRMINMQNHTTWDADSGGIASGRVDGVANANLDWWWINGDPVVDIGYVNAPHIGGSYAGAAFYCDGSNFCRSCSTAGCGIALTGHFQFNSGGQCSGWGTFEGEIVPAGRFDYEVSR